MWPSCDRAIKGAIKDKLKVIANASAIKDKDFEAAMVEMGWQKETGAERDFFCFMAFRLGWEIGFFLGARGFSFAREREKKKFGVFLVFFVVFVVFWGCFCAFWCFVFVFRALARKKMFFSGAGMSKTGNSRIGPAYYVATPPR